LKDFAGKKSFTPEGNEAFGIKVPGVNGPNSHNKKSIK
jgi:hypothetical protein